MCQNIKLSEPTVIADQNSHPVENISSSKFVFMKPNFKEDQNSHPVLYIQISENKLGLSCVKLRTGFAELELA